MEKKLLLEIARKREEMAKLIKEKELDLLDAEVYRYSCIIDDLVVEYIKLKKSKLINYGYCK